MKARFCNLAGPEWVGKEQRNALRVVVDWEARVITDRFGSCAVKITDCTNRGCRIKADLSVTVGTFVRIAIPKFTDVEGWVAWAGSAAIGVDFAHPLPSNVLEYVIMQNEAI